MKAPLTEINVSNKASSNAEDKTGRTCCDELLLLEENPSDEDFERATSQATPNINVDNGELEKAIVALKGVLTKLGKSTVATKTTAVLAAKKKVAENAEKILELHRHCNGLSANLAMTRERIMILEGKRGNKVDHSRGLKVNHPSTETSTTLVSSDTESWKQNTCPVNSSLVSTIVSMYNDSHEEFADGEEAIVTDKQEILVNVEKSTKVLVFEPIITFNSVECEVEWNEVLCKAEQPSKGTPKNENQESGNVSSVHSNDWSTIADGYDMEKVPCNHDTKRRKYFVEAMVVPLEIQVRKTEGKDSTAMKVCASDTNTTTPRAAVNTAREKGIRNRASHGLYTGDVIDGCYPNIVIQKKAPKVGGCFLASSENLCCFGGNGKDSQYIMTFKPRLPG